MLPILVRISYDKDFLWISFWKWTKYLFYIALVIVYSPPVIHASRVIYSFIFEWLIELKLMVLENTLVLK